jgi:hypothetical protein
LADSLDNVRKEMARLAKHRATRRAQFTRERPVRWTPSDVIDPRTGEGFTSDAAWDLVAELLENGHPIRPIKLRKPSGKSGYVMKTKLRPEDPDLYIKVEPGGGCVFGRSFHYDNEDADEGE